jgi:hypothetical protein
MGVLGNGRAREGGGLGHIGGLGNGVGSREWGRLGNGGG